MSPSHFVSKYSHFERRALPEMFCDLSEEMLQEEFTLGKKEEKR